MAEWTDPTYEPDYPPPTHTCHDCGLSVSLFADDEPATDPIPCPGCGREIMPKSADHTEQGGDDE